MVGNEDQAARESPTTKLNKLRARIKNTSSVRFGAARRVRLNYYVAQLTVIVLSLWAIVISYMLATDLATTWHLDRPILDTAGVILPILVVVFSLIERGENYVRSYQLEMSARQLRELSDQLYAASAIDALGNDALIGIFGSFSQRYSDILERSPVNHDDVDHFHRYFSEKRKKGGSSRSEWLSATGALFYNWCQCQSKRVLYLLFWLAPAALFRLASR